MLKIEKIYKILILMVITIGTPASAADSAEQHFEAGNWAAAADAYARRIELSPDDAAAWFRLAVSARQAERISQAQVALEKAEGLQFSPVRIGLERARLAVSTGDADAAISALEGVAKNGFTTVNVITGDPLLSTLSGRQKYDSLVADMSRLAFPCEHDPQFREFDFWIGDWDVHIASGAFAGSNRIERAQHGCLLIEHWRSATGGTGSSINYVDKTSGEWVQIWNDAAGSQINIRGGLTPDGMLLTGTIHYVANGSTAPFRGLWTLMEDGRVRQFFEQQSIEDQAWTPWFEGFYTRKSVEPTDSR